MLLPLRSIARRPGRAALTVVGVALAIALAVTMFSLREGVRGSTRDLVESSGIDLFLYPNGTDPLAQGTPNSPAGELAQGHSIAALVANVSGVRLAAPMLHEPLYVHAHGNVSDANSLGFIPSTTSEFILPPFISGHRMETLHDPMREAGNDPAAATGEMVVNEHLARVLDLEPGDEVRLSLSPSNTTNALVFIVSGVTAPDFESPQEKIVYVHLSELQFVTRKIDRDAVDFIGVKLEPGADAAKVAADVKRAVPVVEPYTNDDLVSAVSRLTQTFEGFAQMIGIVTLGVAVLYVSTVMMIVVNERTPELGALRAIGMSQSRLFTLVLAEAAILITVAAIIGFGLGYLGALGFDAFLRQANAARTPASFHFTRFSWGLLLEVAGFTAIMGLVAGLIPAWRATRVNLLTALRSV